MIVEWRNRRGQLFCVDDEATMVMAFNRSMVNRPIK